MMRILPVVVLAALSLSTIGCVEDATSSLRPRRNVPAPDAADATGTTASTAQPILVNGTVDQVGAQKVDVLAMDERGALEPVGSAAVKDGKFQVQIPAGASPIQVFILQAKGVGDAVLGSGIVNGLPAFVQAFAVDATLDIVTSFKAEVLQTIARKGVPGAQSYINVLDAYVDAQLANAIAVDSVITSDVVGLAAAVADAVVAAEEVIEDTLRKAGLPVDFTALEKAQATTVSGLQGFVLDASNKRISGAKNLVAGFEKGLADLARPIDDAIFNAVVNGGGAFGATMKQKAPAKGFAASKSAFTLTSHLSAARMNDAFAGTALAPDVLEAASAFTAAVGKAFTAEELEAARQSFLKAVVGRDPASVLAPLSAVVQKLADALSAFDPARVAEMLAQIDTTALTLPADVAAVVGPDRIAPVTSALRLVQKQVAQ